MNPVQEYKAMCRDIIRDQGDPDDFHPNAVRLSDEQLAVAMKVYDDVLPEVVGEVQETIIACLEGRQIAQLLGNTVAEAIGTTVIAAVRGHLLRTVRKDLECEASDMVLEALEDAEFAREPA